MDDKKALEILVNMQGKYNFSDEEKAALKEAIGLLSWTSLAKSGPKSRKAKLEKDSIW